MERPDVDKPAEAEVPKPTPSPAPPALTGVTLRNVKTVDFMRGLARCLKARQVEFSVRHDPAAFDKGTYVFKVDGVDTPVFIDRSGGRSGMVYLGSSSFNRRKIASRNKDAGLAAEATAEFLLENIKESKACALWNARSDKLQKEAHALMRRVGKEMGCDCIRVEYDRFPGLAEVAAGADVEKSVRLVYQSNEFKDMVMPDEENLVYAIRSLMESEDKIARLRRDTLCFVVSLKS